MLCRDEVSFGHVSGALSFLFDCVFDTFCLCKCCLLTCAYVCLFVSGYCPCVRSDGTTCLERGLPMLVSAADVLVEQSVDSSLRYAFGRIRQAGTVEFYVRNVGSVNVSGDYEDMDASLAAKFLIAREKHVAFIRENIHSLFLPLLNAEQSVIAVKHANVSSLWSMDNLSTNDLMFVAREPVLARVSSVLKPSTEGTDSYEVVDPYRPSFEGPLAEAYLRARSRAVPSNPMGWEVGSGVWLRQFGRSVKDINGQFFSGSLLSLSQTSNISVLWRDLTLKRPVTPQMLRDARNELLRERARLLDRKAIKDHSSSERFRSYWNNLKQAKKSVVDSGEVVSSFKTVPVLPAGTATSRTWGIEIETIHAELTSRPAGWDRRYDGSLSNDDGDSSECNCGCDDCYDDNHCQYDDCYHGSDGGDCAEFVSPILNHFNSDGLRRLCDDLGNSSVNTTPGIHVHVGAGDLTIPDIARLARAYSVVSPFLWPLMDRQAFTYCQDVSSDNIAFWLAQARSQLKSGSLSPSFEWLPTQKVNNQPDNRYRDLNLQALSAHGTIEFRAMGPVYNYEHLVRWAWLCREMVNVAKLDLDPSIWTGVNSMADLVQVLRTYGQELPPDGFADLDLSGLPNLSVERDAELAASF